MNSGFDPRFFPPSTPRAVEGGLRARSARGKIASTWWSTRFIQVLEATGMGGRLSRGRNYARRGQVISLELTPGQVSAAVQGSRARPYRVRIGVTAYGKDQWARVEESLAADAWFVAQLLAGEMPPDIEGVFESLGLALFPQSANDLSLDCSCPDWSVPCKHLAAVFYLLAERFDADPFEILAWRGRDREDLLSRLDAVASDASEGSDAATPLTELLEVFYVAAAPSLRPPTVTGPDLLDQLPPVPVTVRGRPLTEVLRLSYDEFAALHDGGATRRRGVPRSDA
ncbi:SWIM zinc finger family protein [Tessaracoccus sp. MC1679]|uniref:SWIM zinc finger family protein n=1 Tax=Tessaracoccus sp. MC1679 TaxID=2760313 RepID=UPI0015FED1DE|nr:SWIM zinc finger family protein [Tessaracoccus sp. MC1679]